MARNDKRLLQGHAVITGAGSGLGRALSCELTKRGVRVTGIGRRSDALRNTANQAGPLFTPHAADVTNPEQIQELFDRFGPVHLLINNAAVYPRRDFLDETPESFMASVGINLGGIAVCTHAALQSMVVTGFGRIVNVATFADVAPLPASSAYSVSKGAARIFTKALIADLGDRFPDIVINDWMPGMLATEMGIPDGLDPANSARWGAELALWHDRSLTGCIFEQNRELPPPRGLKSKIRDRLLMRRTELRRLDG